jgi:hypothetical protein
MAGFMQKLLPPEIPEGFEIDVMFCGISDEESMRKGVRAFDKPKKESHEFSDNTSIPTSYGSESQGFKSSYVQIKEPQYLKAIGVLIFL